MESSSIDTPIYLKQLSHKISIISNVLLESRRVDSRPIWIEAQVIGCWTEIMWDSNRLAT